MALLYKNKFYGTRLFGIIFLPSILINFAFYDDKIVIDDIEIPLENIEATGLVDMVVYRSIAFKFKDPPHLAQLNAYILDGSEIEQILELLREKEVKINGERQLPKGAKITLQTDTYIEKGAPRDRLISVIVSISLVALVLGGLMLGALALK